MKRKPVKIIKNGPADRYAGPKERIVEFSGSKLGGLISVRETDEGNIVVEVYRADKGVMVRAGGKFIPAHDPSLTPA